MNEFDFHGLQKLRRSNFKNLLGNRLHQRRHTVQAFIATIVERIAHDRMARVTAMYANLVRTSRFQLQFQKRCNRKELLGNVMRTAFLTALHHSHLETILRVTANRSVNRSFEVTRATPYKRIVRAMERTRFKLVRQMPMSGIVFRDHHKPRRILVQTMDNPRTERTVHGRKIFLEVVQESCGKRSLAHTITRVHHQIARLVDDHDIVIFVNDVQRNIFGFKRRRFLLDHLFNDNRHPRFYAEVLHDFATADLDFARFNQLLHVCAGDIFHNADKKLVDTFTIMLFFYDVIHF